MDAAFRSPLVDCFRRGDVMREVRMLAAAGALAPRAHEQLVLLMLLGEDADPEVAAAAERTLQRLPLASLQAFLARADVTSDIRDFFARRGVLPAQASGDANEAPLFQEAPEGAAEGGAEAQAAGDPEPGERRVGAVAPADDADDAARQGTTQRLANLGVADRMKVAMQGTREERGVLIRDPNRLVAAAVLSSPKLTESEVEAIARMTNVSDEVLRTVGTTRTWLKNYNVVSALTRNAKTPIAVSLGLLNRLNERDVKMLSADRNVPEPIRMAARKMYVQAQTRRH